MDFDIPAASGIVLELVQDAYEKGTMEDLTPRVIRRQVEAQLGLDGGFLDQYKSELKFAIDAAVQAVEESGTESSSGDLSTVKEKEIDSNGKAEKTSNTSAASNGNEKPKKKRKTPPSGSAEDMAKSSKSSKTFKSKEYIDDDDDEEEGGAAEGSKAASASFTVTKVGPPRKQKKTKQDSLDAGQLSGVDPKPQKKKKKPSEEVEVKEVHDADRSVDGEQDKPENDDDEPPRKKSKPTVKEPKSSSSGQKPEKKKGRVKKPTVELSPNEEQVKKLKALIVACGVRKVWSKELKDCETPSSQIVHLRRMLVDLGMKGRMSMEQAKSIKQKREFEQEMADITEFAAKHSGEGRASRSTAKKGAKAVESSDEGSGKEDAESNSEEESAAQRPKTNARKSILAFLGDQSD